MFIVIVLIVIAAVLALKWGTKTFDYFEKQGIKFTKPYPFIGSSKWLFMRQNIITIAKEYYDQFPNEKIYGIFNMRSPFYCIRDPELIKHLTIKEFDHFPNHMDFIDVDHNDISGNMLALLRGQKWKEMRNALTPAFTGNKMRMMFDLISDVGKRMTEYLGEQQAAPELKICDIKDLFSRFTNDVIATCAFGIECDSFRDRNNEFFQIGQKLTRFTDPTQMAKLLMFFFFPRFAKAIGLTIFPEKARKLFVDLIIENMKIREKENIYRPDMINLLLQLKRNELKNINDSNEQDPAPITEDVPMKTTWTDNELIAQCYIFFQAGFETTSGTLQFVAYELARSPDVQRTLIEEINRVHESLQGQPITYDKLMSIKYLDMVILETLRLWPPIFVTERECVKDFVYKDDDGLQFRVEKGSFIWIPIHPLHMDEKYFPDPEKFDPERFDNPSKFNNSGYYMPFGVGPRICIGSRFAMMEMKIALYYLLLKFTFEICPETQVPLKLKNSMAGWVLDKKIKLCLKPQNM